MTTRTVFLLILTVYLTAFALHASFLRKTVYGDGIFYFSWLRSVIIDHDIDFGNDYAHFSVSQPRLSSGAFGNKYSVGPALAWAPLFVMTHKIVRGDGWGLPYQISAGITSVLASIFGLVLLYRLLGGSSASLYTVLLVSGATNLLFYGSIDPVNSHALSYTSAVIFLSLLTSRKKHWIAIGASVAMLASIRLQDAVYAIAFLPFLHQLSWKRFFLGFIVGFLPQYAAWIMLNGTLVNPYISGGESFSFLHPHILGVLFSPNGGLILWTPVVGLGMYGLLKDHGHRMYLLILILEIYLIASWSTWWQGASVGGRMFVSSLPLIAVGLQPLMTPFFRNRLTRSILPLLTAGICLLNALGIVFYLLRN